MKKSTVEKIVSVIVPIYNVENYLCNCIDSILRQTYFRLEIILIDDGSPDNCGLICDDYAKKDERIKVVHKENGGLSDARNVGIRIATGEYITCIDSDDYISNDFVEYLINIMNESDADISICGFLKTIKMNENEQGNSCTIKVYKPEDALEAMLYAQDFTTSAWGKLYKRELFDDVEYPVGKYSEDMFTTYKLINKSKKIICSDRICYYYLHRTGSILNSTYSPRHLDVLEALRIIKSTGCLINPELQSAYKSQFVSSMAELLEKQPPYDENTCNLWEEAKKYLFQVAKNPKASKRVRAQALLMMSGRKFATYIIVMYYNYKWKG